MASRFISLFYDINAQLLRDSTGMFLNPSRIPSITFGENVLVNLTVVTDSALTAYTLLDAAMSFEAIMNNNYGGSSTPMVKTINAAFNVDGDFAGGNADVAAGQLSFSLDANTTAYLANVGTIKELTGVFLEITASEVVAPSNIIQLIINFDYRSFGALSAGGDPVAGVAMTGLNWEEITDPDTLTQGVRFFNDDGETLEVVFPVGV